MLPYSDSLLQLDLLFWAGMFFLPPISTPSIAYVSRFIVGLAAGLGICLGPIYLSEIAPAKIKGNLGLPPSSIFRHTTYRIPRRSNAAGYCYRYHGYPRYRLRSRHSTTMALGVIHILGDIVLSVFYQSFYRRIALVSPPKRSGRTTEISYPQTVG